MLQTRRKFREILGRSGCTIGASIFDPLSARIADMLGWEICKLPGSMGKIANLAVPDGVSLSNPSDLVDVCRRIGRASDACLVVDADDGGGNALNVGRTVRELEAVGVVAIEIEDNLVPRRFGEVERRHGLMVSPAEQVGKLKAAVAARRDTDTVIVARSCAFAELDQAEAQDRIRAYSDTGAEAIMLPEVRNGRADIEAAAEATHLPLILLRMPAELMEDAEFLRQARVRVRYTDQAAYQMAVKAIHDGLSHLRDGRPPEGLASRRADSELLRKVPRTEFFKQWQERFLKD